jgi:hypothetical protein
VQRKLSLLELASELSNVSRACKMMGYLSVVKSFETEWRVV